MDRDTIDRIQDLDTLRAIARTLATENDLLHKRLAELTARLAKAEGADAASLQQEIALLQQKLAARERALFAPSSEKRPHPAAEPSDSPAPRTGHGPTPQPRPVSSPAAGTARSLRSRWPWTSTPTTCPWSARWPSWPAWAWT